MSNASDYDVVVIGAGIIGLATARAILAARPGIAVAIVDKGRAVAEQQTGHNSGVIHSGIYYRPGSLKAQYCAGGRAELERFCEEHNVPFERCGKLIVATRAEELPRLETLHERATANGVPGVELVGPERIREIEPHVVAQRALWAPTTGIVDFTAVAGAMASDVQAAGAELLLGHAVRSAVRDRDSTVLRAGDRELRARLIVNCAGLHADRIAVLLGVRPAMRIVPFRGEYYTLAAERSDLVRGLIYPVPDPELPFLGVHFTRNIRGYVEAGPNAVLATAREGYRKRDVRLPDVLDTLRFPGFWRMVLARWHTGLHEVHRSLRKAVFVRDLQRMVPEVRAEDLVGGGSGVRAQAVGADGALLDDFVIEQTAGAVHVLNAPSPGATSSLAIGRHIATLAVEALGG